MSKLRVFPWRYIRAIDIDSFLFLLFGFVEIGLLQFPAIQIETINHQGNYQNQNLKQ